MVTTNLNDINDETKWSSFVEKLIDRTYADKITWDDCSEFANRTNALGRVFISEVVTGKFVAVYRYRYDYYTDVDECEARDEVAIELVDQDAVKLWRLPHVRKRHALIDLIEFKEADAEGTLNAFLQDDGA